MADGVGHVRSYIFRAVYRHSDGWIGPTLDQRSIAAVDDQDAVAQARRLDLDLATVGATAAYLTAADGRAIWSLHVAEASEPES